MKQTPSPVQSAADELGLEVHAPQNFKSPETVGAFAALDCDLAVVVAYGLILPQVILAAPRLGCWNIHASLLPRWRGAAPVQRAIMAGDTKTGIAIMQMEAGLDTGPFLKPLKRRSPPVIRAKACMRGLPIWGRRVLPKQWRAQVN